MFGKTLSGWWQRCFPPKALGQRGEEAAARFLRRRGCKILARGDRLRRRDELDLVVLDGKTIVFVEVKTRRSQEFGHPAEAVDPAKQRRLTRLAVTFLKRHRLLEHPARFDVVAVTWPEGSRSPTIEHIQNAFEAAGKDGFYS
jgi:putative endonuclease